MKTYSFLASTRTYVFFRALFNQGKLPDFLIMGGRKCGSTYLWHILKKHPDIEMSPHFLRRVWTKWKVRGNRKETYFFSTGSKPEKKIKYYKALFNNNTKLQGEASATYSASTYCHEKIHKFLPDAKLIILIRNPVERAFSAFNHMIRVQNNKDWGAGYDIKKSFDENVELDIRSNFKCGDMISAGFYIEQIKSLLNYYPKNQLLIIITEQMKRNPKKTYDEVCDFLGVKMVAPNLEEKVHIGTYFEKMDEQTAKKLYDLYKPYNEELYKFLGYRIKEWDGEKIA